jgi:hypothetical protein
MYPIYSHLMNLTPTTLTTHREYIFELRLVRRGNGVVVELRTKLVYEHVSLIFVDENRNLPIHGIADSWDGHRHIAGGPSFSRLLSEALILLDHLKLDIMAEVLESSLQKQGLSQVRSQQDIELKTFPPSPNDPFSF